MKNDGNYIISLTQFCKWLAVQAEKLDVQIFPAFAATEIYFEADRVCGILTGEKGLNRSGRPKSQYQPGMLLRATQVIFAEGCRGSLTQQLINRFQLSRHADPQTYALGIKELWEMPEDLHQPGLVSHSIGWPLDNKTYGGSFMYQWGKNLLSLGFVVGLDYQNPYLNPYEEFQRFKTHPIIYSLLIKSKRVAYGARTLVEGGLQSLPKLTFPGGLIVGDAAGFLNVPKIKGIHHAIKSGLLAAESIMPLFLKSFPAPIEECIAYTQNIKKSWVWKELYRARNIRPAFRFGLWGAILYAAIDTYLFRGHAPWTLHHHRPDNETLKKASESKPIIYPKHDNQVTFDLPSSVYLSNLHHEENQVCHLKLKNNQVPIEINLIEYASPETRYCPAGVYEILSQDIQPPRLQINCGNCIQCKACDIKDPTQNIVWTPAEGGSGPFYELM